LPDYNLFFAATCEVRTLFAIQDVHPLLSHDAQKFFFAELRVFLFTDVDKTISAYIERITINFLNNLPAKL